MKAELYPLFGGYHGYRAAPAKIAQEQEIRLYALWSVKAEQEREYERQSRES